MGRGQQDIKAASGLSRRGQGTAKLYKGQLWMKGLNWPNKSGGGWDIEQYPYPLPQDIKRKLENIMSYAQIHLGSTKHPSVSIALFFTHPLQDSLLKTAMEYGEVNYQEASDYVDKELKRRLPGYQEADRLSNDYYSVALWTVTPKELEREATVEDLLRYLLDKYDLETMSIDLENSTIQNDIISGLIDGKN